jgi:hypothetical protein
MEQGAMSQGRASGPLSVHGGQDCAEPHPGTVIHRVRHARPPVHPDTTHLLTYAVICRMLE